MAEGIDIPAANPFVRRTRALSRIMLEESHLFGYPSMKLAAAMTTDEALDACLEQARRAHAETGAAQAERAQAHSGGAEAGRLLRIEHTRLFAGSPRSIPLEGHHWAVHRTALSQAKGERVAVEAAYRALGLRNKPGVNVPADHLASELDYAAYVLAAESAAWKAGEVESAREWRQLLDEFLLHHLADCALGVAGAVLGRAGNPHLRFHAALLQAAVRSCLPAAARAACYNAAVPSHSPRKARS